MSYTMDDKPCYNEEQCRQCNACDSVDPQELQEYNNNKYKYKGVHNEDNF